MSVILDRLRQALDESDETRYRIAQNTGISEAQLSRFVRGGRGLSIETAEQLAEYLELQITITPRRRVRTSRRKN